MYKQTEQAPLGAAFLISAMMIYPSISAISLDTIHKTITFEFITQPKEGVFDQAGAFEKIKKGIRFYHMIEHVKPNFYEISSRGDSYQDKILVQRDMKTLVPTEINCMVELFERYYSDDSEWDEIPELTLEQWQQHNQLYETLYQYVTQGEYQSLRAFRDFGTIYIHQMNQGKSGVELG